MRDIRFDIDNKSITHRPDLWGHLGFARELSAIYGGELRTPVVNEALREGSGPVAVSIEAASLCGRYQALFAKGGSNELGGPSPAWMQRRLIHCGLRPLSLAVDVSNYVMLELGQPTHPFDRRQLRGDRIVVREAMPEERLITLDGEDRLLPRGSCIIADTERAIAVAGVIGGEQSGIAEDTSELVLESAWFDPIAVRKAGTAIGLRTDALTRFEKQLDPASSELAMRRYASLLKEVAPGVEIAEEYVVEGELTSSSATLRLRPDRARMKLGAEISDDAMSTLLGRLGFAVEARDGGLDVLVPSYRATRDVQTEDDLIEEVGRIHGYDKIPTTQPRFQCAPIDLEPVNRAVRRSVALLSSRLGFSEVLSYPYMDDNVLARAGGDDGGAFARLQNPLQQSAARLRRSIVPWLIEFVDRNVRVIEDVRLYEHGRVFLPGPDAGSLPDQPMMLAGVRADRVTKKGDAGLVLRRLKGSLEEVGEAVRRPFTFRAPEGAAPPWAHPARCADVFVGESRVGAIAEVHPQIRYDFGWKGEAAAFEVNLTSITGLAESLPPYQAPSKFPPSRIDISFLAPFGITYSTIRDGLESATGLLTQVELVDEYTSDPVEKGWRSLTLRLSFQSEERTLSDDDVTPEVSKARQWLESQGAVLRGT